MHVSPINSKIYTEFFERNKQLFSFYQNPHWLLNISDQNLILGCFDDADRLVAVWPFCLIQRFKFVKCLSQPILNQSLDPIISFEGIEGAKSHTLISYEVKIIESFLKYIKRKKYSSIKQGLNVKKNYAFVLLQYGFRLNFRLNYLIESSRSLDEAWQFMHRENRRKIRQMEDQYTFCRMESIQTFCEFKKTHKPYSGMQKNLLEKAIQSCRDHKLGDIYGLRNINNELISAAFLAEDNHRVYFLSAANDKEKSKNTTSVYFLWKSIEIALKKNKSFDFEGSMLPEVEKLFRRFSPVQEFFLVADYTGPLWLRLLELIENWRNR